MIGLKNILVFLLIGTLSCDTGQLEVIADLPRTMYEVSGIETARDSEALWMINDSGNRAKLYKLGLDGKIIHEIKIDAKNRDWEDLTQDQDGNIYIGDFGNNFNDRSNLSILKVDKRFLESFAETPVEKIRFSYPDQEEFPPKKKTWYFDCEAFFHFNDSLYIFTKSRVRKDWGRTNLYKIPARSGKHVAQFIGSFNSCNNVDCSITAADISEDGKTMVLLTHGSVWVFTKFERDNFFNGKVTELSFDHLSQKESICFKNDSTVYIADERAQGAGGNLYKFSLN